MRPYRPLGSLEEGGRRSNPHFVSLGAISIGRAVVPFPKIVINLFRTYEKLPSK